MQRLLAAARIGVRLPLALAVGLAGLALVTCVFPVLRAARRERIVMGWSRSLLRACGVRLYERPSDGATSLSGLHGGHLLLMNHVSWLDVFLVLSIVPARFVAKSEIARWPVLGTLVRAAGTLFLERGKRHAVHRMNRRIADVLREGRHVAVFPEGTTSDGVRLMPFHGNLVEGALHAGAPVVPVGVRYLDLAHRPTEAAIFFGEIGLASSFARVLRAPGIVAELHPLSPVEGARRQVLTERARYAISARLALPLDDALPEVVRRVRREATELHGRSDLMRGT